MSNRDQPDPTPGDLLESALILLAKLAQLALLTLVSWTTALHS
jgi:hypothetical protein